MADVVGPIRPKAPINRKGGKSEDFLQGDAEPVNLVMKSKVLKLTNTQSSPLGGVISQALSVALYDFMVCIIPYKLKINQFSKYINRSKHLVILLIYPILIFECG